METFDHELESDEEDSRRSLSEAEDNNKPSPLTSNFEPAEEWIVTLFKSEHTWTGFLKDSPECLTMAVIDEVCFELHDKAGYGRRCQATRPQENGRIVKWTPGYPVLQTAILLNESIPNNEGLQLETSDSNGQRSWNATRLKKGCHFTLGEHGRLTVYVVPSKNMPAIMEWEPVTSSTWQELKDTKVNGKMLGKNPKEHHQEYVRGLWNTDPHSALLISNPPNYDSARKAEITMVLNCGVFSPLTLPPPPSPSKKLHEYLHVEMDSYEFFFVRSRFVTQQPMSSTGTLLKTKELHAHRCLCLSYGIMIFFSKQASL